MKANPLHLLEQYGQSVWLDYISRDMITNGGLRKLIDEDGLSGMTSNPAIFEKAISGSSLYDDQIMELAEQGKDPKAIYEAISIQDVGMAADEFRPLYDNTGGKQGYVSIEVNPHLAHDTQATILEARRLWNSLNRPNVMIKVPATLEGLPAVRQLISEGINVNITLLFGLPRYALVAGAFLDGLELRDANGGSIGHVASVASFFISRIATLVDPLEDQFLAQNGEGAHFTTYVKGHVATASARLAYQMYKEMIAGEPFVKLSRKGARAQQLLWASTSTKNPKYSDVRYVEELIGPDTINTLPPETLIAFRDHGKPQPRLESELDQAREVMEELSETGIDIDQITQQLEDEGVEKFNTQYDKIMEIIGARLR